ncbi:MAG: sensor histidine kinase [Scytonema sp. RU_4_4]|nr:sensor histidine kinase [Scytonema sp. RU_4_4]NJR73639.1 sensor histidine kinase [Scytonema sp. CRU_2_7]
MAWEELSSVYEQLHQCALQIEDIARARERQRIARDLHDSLGQTLTALNIQLQTALKLWRLDPAKAKFFLTRAQRLGANAIKEVRQSVCSLRAMTNADKPLEQLIESLVEDFQQATGLSISTYMNLSAALPQEIATTVYRVVQEALTNICKHAAATVVQIQIKTIPGRLQLIITDNGKGFKRDVLPKGFGLQGMAERVTALNGQLYIESEPAKGCRVKIELPIPQEATPEKFSNNVSRHNIANNNANHNDFCILIAARPTARSVISHNEQSSCLNSPPSQLESTGERLSNSSYQAIDESFIHQCKQQLTDLVGPFGPLLIKETLKASPGFSRRELVETIATKIPDPQVAAEFRQVLSSELNLETEQGMSRCQFRVEWPFQQEQSLDNIAADILALTATESTGSLALYYNSRLEKILADYIGSLASSLLQQVTQQMLNCKELVARLLSHIPTAQQTEFEQQVTRLLNSTASQLGSTGEDLSGSSYQMIDENFLCQCQQQLIDLVGPFASLLIQETLKSSPEISPLELVEKIATKIPDAQVAVEFQQRMSLWSRNKNLSSS